MGLRAAIPHFFSAPLRKLTQKNFALRAKKKRSTESTKTPPKKHKNTKKTPKKHQKHFFSRLHAEKKRQKKYRAYARKLTRRTQKIIHSPAPFKGAQERGIAALFFRCGDFCDIKKIDITVPTVWLLHIGDGALRSASFPDSPGLRFFRRLNETFYGGSCGFRSVSLI